MLFLCTKVKILIKSSYETPANIFSQNSGAMRPGKPILKVKK